MKAIVVLAILLCFLVLTAKLKAERRKSALYEQRWRHYEMQWNVTASARSEVFAMQREWHSLKNAYRAKCRECGMWRDLWKQQSKTLPPELIKCLDVKELEE
jgi:hypothetical protein